MSPSYKNLSLEDIFLHKKFEPKTFVPFPLELPQESIAIIENHIGGKLNSNNCQINKEKTHILFKTEEESIYRRSTKAHYFLLDILTSEIVAIHSHKIMHAQFSPDGEKITFVWDNNLFIYFLKEKKNFQITNDGKWNHIINGNCDWVYEEEFAFSQAYQWSPNSEMLAYFRFDESKVKEYSFPIYDDQYNQNYTYKYPKAGEENSDVTIHVYHLNTEKTVTCTTRSDGGYVPKILWSPENRLQIFHLNRHQNELNIWENNPVSGDANIFYSEKDDRYIDLTDDWFFLGNNLLFTSEKAGYRNIYLKEKDKEIIPLTQNSFELSEIVGIDKKHKWIYFIVAYPNPMERHLFVVDVLGNQKQLTENSGWNHAFFNREKSKIIIENSNIREPSTYIQYNIEITENLPELQYEKTVSDNEQLKENLLEYQLGEIAFLQIPIDGKADLNSWMLFPPDFDENKKYPVLFCNYGGSGSQTVVNRFGAAAMWQHFLSQEQYIIVSVDNTGTGGRGADFKKKAYLQLGKYEIEDQIYAANYLSKLPYIDAECIGHWGWSFGGFMSSLAITKGADIFTFAIAIAPVTSWKYYDTIYTERYMRTPEENPNGYDQNSPFANIEDVKGKFLLVHGSADDNVHLQHTMQFSKKLVDNNIPFDMMIYTDKNHRINGGNTPIHLWKKLVKWLKENT